MPESDRLAKLIAHRQQQERKNDKIRVNKNRVENDKLKVQVTYLDWSKVLRGREFASAEEEYVRRLEKIYDRQMCIEQKRIEEVENKRKEKEAKRRKDLPISDSFHNARLESVEGAGEMTDRERRRQLHGTKQEWTKQFMNKAKSLSGGYRDNDPPKAYYKRKGLVPPDRLVAPEVSAEAQASYGGGWQTPSSAEHLYKSSKLPKETPYGVEEPSWVQRSLSRGNSVRSQSARSGRSEFLMSLLSSSEEEDDDLRDFQGVDDVIQVNVRPTTAPARRERFEVEESKEEVLVTEKIPHIKESQSMGLEPEIQMIEFQEPEETVSKPTRPATAAASVRFVGNVGNVDQSIRSPAQSARQKGSLKVPHAMMFYQKKSEGGMRDRKSKAASAGARIRPRRSVSQPVMMSNAEQERIRLKIQQKAECLQMERIKRLAMACMKARGEEVPRWINSATSTRELSYFEQYLKNLDSYYKTQAWNAQSDPNKPSEVDTMLEYLERCERGLELADANQAKSILLNASRETVTKLKENVRTFVQVR